MARRVKEPDLTVEQREHQITEALEKKKRQLDREIAEFKAEKEHDYRVFERKLRGKSKEHDPHGLSRIQRKRGRSKQKDAVAGTDPLQQEETYDVQQDLANEKSSQQGPATETEDLSATTRSKTSPGGSAGPPDRLADSLHREEDVRGVLTPSFISLMGETSADQRRKSQEHLQPPFFDPGDLSVARHIASAMFSSSAETTHPPMKSPPLPPARPLSSSVPPEKPLHHRRDSSRSDASIASLRSSLRDPKQPRSPKRVLFSIDDTLVSPSTSPIAQRSKSVIPTVPADLVDANGGFEQFEVVRNQNGDYPTVNKSERTGFSIGSSNVPVNSWTASLLTFGRAADSVPSKATPSATGADDFEHLESDDLFTFDEDMGRTGKGKTQEAGLHDEYDENVEVDEKNSNDPLTASSPHAGSLPIEIKWPGRREGRG